MGRVIIRVIIMVPLASGFLATGKADGLLLGGKGLGSRATGDIADKRTGLKNQIQSRLFCNVIRLYSVRRAFLSRNEFTVQSGTPKKSVPFLYVIRNHFGELLLLRIV